MFSSFSGSPAEIGKQYGQYHSEAIRANLAILVHRAGHQPLPRDDKDFIAWRRNQESILNANWPWLLAEMEGVAHSVGAEFEDILLLNLRSWQYDLYFPKPAPTCCSSFAITLDDGTVACAGTLDDPIKYYCGVIGVQPDDGYAYLSFPIAGTSWASRGINEKGLSVGISSQILEGLRPSESAMNQDLAIRVILQTCATVDEVREFCRTYPFTMNLVCVDSHGNVFCAHQTTAGLHELPMDSEGCALTNHIASEELESKLKDSGVTQSHKGPTSRPRRDKLISFIRERSGKATADEVRRFISVCDENDPGSINRHNGGTCFLTFANPQNNPTSLWVMQPHESTTFELLSVPQKSTDTNE